MPIGAIVGGGAMLGGAVLQSSSAKKASKAQVAAQAAAQKTQQDNLNAILSSLSPYSEIGKTAISSLMKMIGPSGPNTDEMMSQLENFPGYQFAMKQGKNALNADLAKMGSSISGNQIAGALEYATGTGAQLFDKYYGYLRDLAGVGQTATGIEANARTGTANNISNSQVAQGEARAQGALAQGQIWSGFLNNASKLAGNVMETNPNSWLNKPVSSLWASSSGGIKPGNSALNMTSGGPRYG